MPFGNASYKHSTQQQQESQQKQQEHPPPTDGRLKLAAAKLNGSTQQTEGSDKRTKSGKFTLAQLRATDGIVPLQAGTNQFDSQRGMTGFGMPRDVKGKHLKRIWELEFPEEACDAPYPPVNQAPTEWPPHLQSSNYLQQQQQQQYQQQQRGSYISH